MAVAALADGPFPAVVLEKKAVTFLDVHAAATVEIVYLEQLIANLNLIRDELNSLNNATRNVHDEDTPFFEQLRRQIKDFSERHANSREYLRVDLDPIIERTTDLGDIIQGSVLEYAEQNAQQWWGGNEFMLRRHNQRATLLKKASALKVLEPLAPTATEELARAAAELDLEPVTAAPPPVSAEQFRLASRFARVNALSVSRTFEQEMFFFAQRLKEWPAGKAFIANDICVSFAISRVASARLRDFAQNSRTSKLRYAILNLLLTSRLTPEGEDEERAARTARFEGNTQRMMRDLVERLEHSLRLSSVAALKDAPTTPLDAWLVHNTLLECVGAMESVREFTAFRGTDTLPFVKTLQDGPLLSWNGIRVSHDAPVLPMIPGGRRVSAFASVSTDGTLCMKRNSLNTHMAEFFFYNFLTKRRSILRGPKIGWICTCEGEVFVGVARTNIVCYAPLRQVLRGMQFDEFKRIEMPREVYWAVVDRASDGLIVFRSTPLNTLVRLDLRTKETRVITCDRRLWSIGPLTGIRMPGALCVAKQHDGDWATFVVFEDGSTKEIGRGMNYIPMLLPSEANPMDYTKAATIDADANFFFREHLDKFGFPVTPYWRSLVRIHRDVFICYCESTQRWHALRIAVP